MEHGKRGSGIANGCGKHMGVFACIGFQRQGGVLLASFYVGEQRITQLKSELQDAERRQSEDIAKIAGDEPVSALESKARRNHGSSASSASVKLENMQKPRSEGWSRA